MARTTIRTRMGTGFLVMLLPMLAGVALAQSRPQPESRLEEASTSGELTTVPFDPADAAPRAAQWFRVTIDWNRADGTGPMPLPETNPAANVPLAPPAVKVPDAVQNLRRADAR